MRKGQFQHVFTFLMLMIIAGIVLLLGYRFLSGILGNACEVEQASFVDQLKKDLKQYSSYGSFHAPAITAPCNAQMICFVDTQNFEDDNGDGIWAERALSPAYAQGTNKIIDEEVSNPSSPPHNIFLIHEDGTTRYVDFFGDKVSLAIPNKPLCINATSGKFRLGFGGKGRTVIISDETHSS